MKKTTKKVSERKRTSLQKRMSKLKTAQSKLFQRWQELQAQTNKTYDDLRALNAAFSVGDVIARPVYLYGKIDEELFVVEEVIESDRNGDIYGVKKIASRKGTPIGPVLEVEISAPVGRYFRRVENEA